MAKMVLVGVETTLFYPKDVLYFVYSLLLKAFVTWFCYYKNSRQTRVSADLSFKPEHW
jgi:hypothetical protein